MSTSLNVRHYLCYGEHFTVSTHYKYLLSTSLKSKKNPNLKRVQGKFIFSKAIFVVRLFSSSDTLNFVPLNSTQCFSAHFNVFRPVQISFSFLYLIFALGKPLNCSIMGLSEEFLLGFCCIYFTL